MDRVATLTGELEQIERENLEGRSTWDEYERAVFVAKQLFTLNMLADEILYHVFDPILRAAHRHGRAYCKGRRLGKWRRPRI